MKPLTEEFSGRLLELAPGRSGLRTHLSVKATMDDKDPDVLTMRASDATLDRYDEVIEAAGWKLESYNRNPVVQNAHQSDDILHTIGKAERTWVEGGALMQVWRFASAANPVAKVARDMYRGGFLNASSVGFVPVRWEHGNDKSDWRRKFLEQELLEVSAVAIPANPNALALALKSGAVDKSDLRELAQLLKHLCSGAVSAPTAVSAPAGGHRPPLQNHFVSKDGPEPKPGASGTGAEIAQLAVMARQLNEVLARS